MICVPFTTPRVFYAGRLLGSNWIVTQREEPLPIMLEFFAYETIGVAVSCISAERIAALDFS